MKARKLLIADRESYVLALCIRAFEMNGYLGVTGANRIIAYLKSRYGCV